MDRATFLKILALGAAIPADARRLLGQIGIEPVADPLKQVTDSVLLSCLSKAGIDKDYVEFAEDYKANHTMAKFYKDRLSRKRFQVISGLPMVRSDDGSKIQPKFETSINRWYFGNNMFEGEVLKTGEITLAPVVDTFSGVPAHFYVRWNPQIYVGGIEVQPVSGPVLLTVDPINSNYSVNVLEWDYGYCKRWLRVIEGRFMERWVFQQSPGADVRIAHNRTGEKGIFRLGQFAIDDDVEFVPLVVFQQAEYPFIISTDSTFYPTDGSYEDGTAFHNSDNTAWSTLVAAAGTSGSSSESEYSLVEFKSGGASDWCQIWRSIFIMDTSSLPDVCIILDVTPSFYGTNKLDDNSATPVVNIYSSNPANDNDVVAGDYDSLGTTPFSDSGISYDSFNTSGYNNWTFNASGIAAISKTGVTKLGARTEHDATDTEPNRGGDAKRTYLYGYFVEQGAGYKPKLVVTYTEGPDVTIDTKDGASELEKIDGVAATSINKVDGKP